MKDKQLLVKSVILLYKETLIKAKGFSSSDKISKILEDISNRHSTDISNLHNVDKIVIDNLLSRIREMLDYGSEHEYVLEEFLNDLEMDCYEDTVLFRVLKESIEKPQTEEELKKSIIGLRRAIDNHYREQEVEAILNKANYTFKFKRSTISNMSEFLGNIVGELEKLDMDNNGDDPAVTSEVDIGNVNEIKDVLQLAVDKNSDAGIMKTGWHALNTMTQGGFRRGEFWMITSMAHRWKTGFTMSIFKQIALYNKPYMLDPSKKPLLVRFSAEDDIEANFQFLYQSLKMTDTNTLVDITKESKDEMAAYIKDKLSVNGYHCKLLRIDPTDWSYHRLLNKIIEYESEGFEVHLCMVDYLSMIPPVGCLQLGGTGSDLRDMYRRVRNFMSNRSITFITPHQISQEGVKLIRGAVGEEDFTKLVAKKGYYDTCGRLNHEVDGAIAIHSFYKENQGYFSATLEKHRRPTVIPESHKTFYLKFPADGPIADDINGTDTSLRSVRADTSNGRADESLFEF